MYVEARGKVYTFYDHAVNRMIRRNIPFELVETTLNEPDDTFDLTPTRRAYDKVIADNRSIRVITDEETNEIVTVYPLADDDHLA